MQVHGCLLSLRGGPAWSVVTSIAELHGKFHRKYRARITDYDKVESLIFSHCLDHGMAPLVELYNGEIIPSRAGFTPCPR